MFGFISNMLTRYAGATAPVLVAGGLKMIGQYVIVDTVCTRISESVREANEKKHLEQQQHDIDVMRKQCEAVQKNMDQVIQLQLVQEDK